jgi:hypothetical protein
VPNIIKHISLDLKTQTDPNTVVVGEFNTSLSSIDRSSRQKINKGSLISNGTINKMDVTDICRVFHLAIAQFTLFSVANGIFSKMKRILGYKSSLSKYKKNRNTPAYCLNVMR